jgi:uncharacterized protein
MPDVLLTRTFPVRLQTGEPDRRLVEGRCVPYGIATRVKDPGSDPYLEVFRPGAFARATKAPDRVHFKYNHGSGLGDLIGRAASFAEADDGLDGSFRVLAGAFGDQALTLVDEGILTGLSIGFTPLGQRVKTTPDGAIIRDRCHLVEVSLTGDPAYPGAVVTGRRTKSVAADVADLTNFDVASLRDPELDARLRAVGIQV